MTTAISEMRMRCQPCNRLASTQPNLMVSLPSRCNRNTPSSVSVQTFSNMQDITIKLSSTIGSSWKEHMVDLQASLPA
ncbi:hypothetical protein RRG08_054575 [Elysia crispata]|uniref:Uncharacterized protein n=1 Tax=Elysia crispata TaxID=231223 RepID=A0AAE1B1J7_9GAST|nr:hypothetical protein RRG08_054575 [Elysia crispata]